MRDARLVPLAVRLGEGERGDGLARGDAGEVLGLGGVVAGVQQRVGGEHDGREVRGAQQAAAHLLEHDDELDVAVARAAELLGDDEALQAHLLAHLRPHGGVVAGLGLHQLADGGLVALGVEEVRTTLRSSSCSSEKAKFMAEQDRRSPVGAGQPAHVYTCVHVAVDGTDRDPRAARRPGRRGAAGRSRRADRHHRRRRARRPARSARAPATTSLTIDDLAARGLLVRARRDDRPEPRLRHADVGRHPPRPARPRGAGPMTRRRVTLALGHHARCSARYLDGPYRPVDPRRDGADHDWCASALALTEALMLVDRIGDDPRRADELRAGAPRRLGTHPRRAGRPAVPRPGRRARPDPAAAHRRRAAPRRGRPPAPPGAVRHVRPGADPGRDGARLRRRVDRRC